MWRTKHRVTSLISYTITWPYVKSFQESRTFLWFSGHEIGYFSSPNESTRLLAPEIGICDNVFEGIETERWNSTLIKYLLSWLLWFKSVSKCQTQNLLYVLCLILMRLKNSLSYMWLPTPTKNYLLFAIQKLLRIHFVQFTRHIRPTHSQPSLNCCPSERGRKWRCRFWQSHGSIQFLSFMLSTRVR